MLVPLVWRSERLLSSWCYTRLRPAARPVQGILPRATLDLCEPRDRPSDLLGLWFYFVGEETRGLPFCCLPFGFLGAIGLAGRSLWVQQFRNWFQPRIPRPPLIENASDRDVRSAPKVCCAAFPIKANDDPGVIAESGMRSSEGVRFSCLPGKRLG